MNIRCENLLDHQFIAETYTQAFERENEAWLVKQIRHSERYIPELSLVAVEGSIVGHILFSHIDLVTDTPPFQDGVCGDFVNAATLQVLSLAPLAVRPQLQRQGIGSALVRAGLARADAMGEAIVIVLGHPQFYCRFGFERSSSYDIEAPFPVPKDAFMVKPLKQYQDRYRGKVVYPPAFQQV